jgi:uncharacterized membrane protein
VEEKKYVAVDAICFGFKAIFGHIRFFTLIFFSCFGVAAAVAGIIALINKDFIQELLTSPMFQTFQECVGSQCFSVVYESKASLGGLIVSNATWLLISSLIIVLFFVCFDLGLKRIALDLYDRNTSNVKCLFEGYPFILYGLIGWALYCLAVWAGFMLFVIPGFILLLRLAFFPFYILDKNVGPVTALQMSYRATQNHFWMIFAFWSALKIISSICMLSFVGIVLTWPLSTLAYAYVYRHIAK